MLRFKTPKFLIFIISLFFLGILQTVFAETSSLVLYKDKNGYFVVKIPTGWEREDYPSETIRSKVAFHHPTEEGIHMRIISGPTPTSDYSLDDLYQENKEKIESYIRQKYPNGTYDIAKKEVEGRQSVIQRNSIPDAIEQEVVLFVNNSISYNIAFTANTKSQFEKNYKTFKTFLSNFVILEKGKKFSDQEIRAGLIANYKRLAEINEQMGLIEDALDFVKEGLSIDPNNKDLIAIEKRLQTKRGKK